MLGKKNSARACHFISGHLQTLNGPRRKA